MKSGKLRHVIRLERATMTPDAYGTPVASWATLATLRAEKVREGLAERIDGAAGAVDAVQLVFRTRAFAGVTLADRVVFLGVAYNIVQIGGGDWQDGRGLELTCEGKP